MKQKNKAEEVSCLLLNDIHDRPHSFEELFAHCNTFAYDFFALNGDMFDYQTDEQQITHQLITPYPQLFGSEKPFVMIRGNQVTRGKYA
jgi:hypothetical protein